jgi:SH3 domain-containing YSC84-like protein 1
MHCLRSLTPTIALTALLAAGPAQAAGQNDAGQDTMGQDTMGQGTTGQGTTGQEMGAQPGDTGEGMEAQTDARETVQNAAEVAERMKSDSQIAGLLDQSQGVFIVPNLVRGAFIVGAQGGDGVLISRQDGQWSDPAFFTLGSISVGAQGGGEVGPVAMILMSEEAMRRFGESDDFTLSAEAGLTIIDYSASAQADLQETDVVMWSDKQGAFVGASISASDIGIDEEANHAYYNDRATPETILSGNVQNQQNDVLQQALRP